MKKEEKVQVKYLKSTNSVKAGTVKTLPAGLANDLVRRGTAAFISVKEEKAVVETKEDKQAKTLKTKEDKA